MTTTDIISHRVTTVAFAWWPTAPTAFSCLTALAHHPPASPRGRVQQLRGLRWEGKVGPADETGDGLGCSNRRRWSSGSMAAPRWLRLTAGCGSPRDWPELDAVGVDSPSTLVGPSFSSPCRVQPEESSVRGGWWEVVVLFSSGADALCCAR